MTKYKDFTDALYLSWGKDTAYRKDAITWNSTNPSKGQCAITALLFNELYGGKIYSGISKSGIVHYWNKKNGKKYDFTKQQFAKRKDFRNVKKWDRNELLATGNVSERYSILRQRVLDNIQDKQK